LNYMQLYLVKKCTALDLIHTKLYVKNINLKSLLNSNPQITGKSLMCLTYRTTPWCDNFLNEFTSIADIHIFSKESQP
jgi:hypothetical protein